MRKQFGIGTKIGSHSMHGTGEIILSYGRFVVSRIRFAGPGDGFQND